MPKDYPIKLAGQIFGDKKYYCSLCSGEVMGFNDKLSAEEYRISGMCQECQDQIFNGE